MKRILLPVLLIIISIPSFSQRQVLQEDSWGNWFADVEVDPMDNSKFIIIGNNSLKSTNDELFASDATIMIVSVKKMHFLFIEWGKQLGMDLNHIPMMIKVDDQDPYQENWIIDETRSKYPKHIVEFCLEKLDSSRMAVRCFAEDGSVYTAVFDINGLREILNYFSEDMFSSE